MRMLSSRRELACTGPIAGREVSCVWRKHTHTSVSQAMSSRVLRGYGGLEPGMHDVLLTTGGALPWRCVCAYTQT